MTRMSRSPRRVLRAWPRRRPAPAARGAARRRLARLADPGRHADGELAGRDVLGDDGARAGLGAVADRRRRTSIVSTPRKAPGADAGPVLAAAVVVGRDRARADVRPLADVGVAEVAHVVLLHARARGARS